MITTPQLLITDDDRDFRETLCSVFEDRGFSTIQAGDGREAVRIAQEESIHCVLIDLHMPRLTGIEAIREIREIHLSLPCILISAELNDEIRNEATGVFSVMEKPVNFRQLTQTVHSALERAWGWTAN